MKTALEIAIAALEDLSCNYGDYPSAEQKASEALAAIRSTPKTCSTCGAFDDIVSRAEALEEIEVLIAKAEEKP